MSLGLKQRAAIGRVETVLREHVALAPSSPAVTADIDISRLCPELDCVRNRLTDADVNALARYALANGVGADRALIGRRLINEETYVRALAQSLAIAFAPLDGRTTRGQCPLTD